ncbi:hypothetical protein TWF281_008667 [Arthrobotrys megalospora]
MSLGLVALRGCFNRVVAAWNLIQNTPQHDFGGPKHSYLATSLNFIIIYIQLSPSLPNIMELHQSPQTSPAASVRLSPVPFPNARSRSPSSRAANSNDRSPKLQHRFLASRTSPSNPRLVPPWRRLLISRNSNRAGDLREDHPIFNDAFYIPHANAIAMIGKRLSRLTNWIAKTHPDRLCSLTVLQDAFTQINAIVEDPVASHIGHRVKLWEFKIKTAGAGYKENEYEDQLRFRELITIKRMIEGITKTQNEKMDIVIANLPKFYWKSSAPLRRMLELGKQISRLELLQAQAKANLSSIVSADRQISDLLQSCNRVLLKVVNILLENRKEPLPPKSTDGHPVGGTCIARTTLPNQPLNTTTEHTDHKT